MRAWVALACLALAACTQAPASEAPPARPGANSPRIVSLNPCSDAILAEVADPGQLAAISHYSHDPASSSMEPGKARRFPSVSGSVEEVLALRPDVVVAGTFLPPATVEAFDRLGMKVVRLPIVSNLPEAREQVRQLAALAGHGERGAELVRRIDAAVAKAAPLPGAKPVTALVWQSGGIVPGRGTLIADLLARTGFLHFSAARGMGQAEVLPLEILLADPPRVVLAAGDPLSDEDRMLHHPALRSLSATRRERFDPALLWCGGPTIVRAVERLAEVRSAL